MAVDCGGKIVQSIGYKAQVTNTSLTNRMAWPWTSKVSKEVNQKKKSNGQIPQTQQTEERAQHGSWQTRAQKEIMEQKQGRDQLFPSQRSDSKR